MAKKYGTAETKERNRRARYFQDVVIHHLAYERDVSVNDKYSIRFDDEVFGTIIVYPKGDLLLFTRTNKWESCAVNWLKLNIIKEKF